MKLSTVLILGAALMTAAPAFAQHNDQRASERHVTATVHAKHFAPRSRHMVARISNRYDVRQERETTAELNRRSLQGQDSGDYNRR